MKGYLVMAYTLRIPWKEERYFLNKFAMKFSYVAMELSRRCTRHRVLSPWIPRFRVRFWMNLPLAWRRGCTIPLDCIERTPCVVVPLQNIGRRRERSSSVQIWAQSNARCSTPEQSEVTLSKKRPLCSASEWFAACLQPFCLLPPLSEQDRLMSRSDSYLLLFRH